MPHPALQRRDDVATTSLCTSQQRLRYAPKWITQRRFDRALPRRLSGTFPWALIGTSQQRLKRTWQLRPISTFLQRLKQVSNETTNHISVVHYQDVAVVRIHEVPLARLYDASSKSQIECPKSLLWYVSTMSRTYVFATSC